jgi:AcrR family transcriptional regulator
MRSALQKAREAPASTKARILATAEQIFAAKGFAGASTREIAATAGVNISSLHYHWESKETLYFAVFQNIYDRILELVRSSIPEKLASSKASRAVVETSMGTLFDYFAEHPNVPKLLVRRLLENDEGEVAIERDILVPAWTTFGHWMEEHSRRKLSEFESHLFMLTIYGVVLVYLLDSRHFTTLLGGSVYDPVVRAKVREYIISLVPTLLGRSRAS